MVSRQPPCIHVRRLIRDLPGRFGGRAEAQVYERDRRLAGGGVLRTVSGILIPWNFWGSAPYAGGLGSSSHVGSVAGSSARSAPAGGLGYVYSAVADGDPGPAPASTSIATCSARKPSVPEPCSMGNLRNFWSFTGSRCVFPD